MCRTSMFLIGLAAVGGASLAFADGFQKVLEDPLQEVTLPVLRGGNPPGSSFTVLRTNGAGLKCRFRMRGRTRPRPGAAFPSLFLPQGMFSAMGKHDRSCEHVEPQVPPHNIQLDSDFTWQRELRCEARSYLVVRVRPPPGRPPIIDVETSLSQNSALFSVDMMHIRDGNILMMHFDQITESAVSGLVCESPVTTPKPVKKTKRFPSVSNSFTTPGCVTNIWTIKTQSRVTGAVILDGWATGRVESRISSGGPITDCP